MDLDLDDLDTCCTQKYEQFMTRISTDWFEVLLCAVFCVQVSVHLILLLARTRTSCGVTNISTTHCMSTYYELTTPPLASGTTVAMVTRSSDAPPSLSSSEVLLLCPFVSFMGLIQLSV